MFLTKEREKKRGWLNPRTSFATFLCIITSFCEFDCPAMFFFLIDLPLLVLLLLMMMILSVELSCILLLDMQENEMHFGVVTVAPLSSPSSMLHHSLQFMMST
ncbi:hypothetical protein PGIGA_G00170150 [Pangasianodon gigas]|uniref:Uncharacterized protein n=1 Tax=Pangasianodon gigas TaxID=30993 RepID=A0ACC5XTK3_PANGG|nr:hypothetical protein [Pangasianodon gigas]